MRLVRRDWTPGIVSRVLMGCRVQGRGRELTGRVPPFLPFSRVCYYPTVDVIMQQVCLLPSFSPASPH